MNHYEVLGVAPDTAPDALRRAYLAAARECHPDFHAGAPVEVRDRNAARMAALNEAWAVLGDPGARAAYDQQLVRLADPGVARRTAREQGRDEPPPGKGWTPRAGDDRWMLDYESWRDEDDRDLVPEPSPPPGRRVVNLLPVGLFAVAVGCVAMGGILTARPLLALGAIAFVLSVGGFVFLPIFEMTRNRRRG